MDFAIAHKDWTLEDWKHVLWSDETKINHLGSDGRRWVWKKPGENLNDWLVEGTLKFGGSSVMLWGCMMWEGIGYACKIDGRMDGDLFVKILDEDWWLALTIMARMLGISSSNRIMTPNIPAKRLKIGSKQWNQASTMACTVSRPKPNRTSLGSLEEKAWRV